MYYMFGDLVQENTTFIFNLYHNNKQFSCFPLLYLHICIVSKTKFGTVKFSIDVHKYF